VAAAGLCWRRQDARVFGYGPRRRLESICWAGANVVPVRATPAAIDAFAGLLVRESRMCSSIVGPADGVLDLWRRLQPWWGSAREIRDCQPLLATGAVPAVSPDPQVRLVRPDEIDLVYPAAVAMYTEEVGVPPVASHTDGSYRERVADLVRSGRTYAKIVDGQVVFKAELAIVTRHTAQVQGVWTAPALRGGGIATRAMSTVVADSLRRVAPTVSLYVNAYNDGARRVYERCGFRQVGTFATVLF
jgi:predicted GNAT family acetyltransferase